MVTLTLLRLFVWAVVLASSGQLYLIARYILWPQVHRILHCPWCWRDAGIEQDFPAPWSSALCTYHRRQQRAYLAARRVARQQRSVAPTRPAVAIEEVPR